MSKTKSQVRSSRRAKSSLLQLPESFTEYRQINMATSALKTLLIIGAIFIVSAAALYMWMRTANWTIV